MSERGSRLPEALALSASVLVLLMIFLPWVRTGALQESDTVNGIDIPVIGWASIAMCVVTIALALPALLMRNRWLWCAHTFSAALVVTGASLVLSTLDVLDSAVLGWITEVLPESVESASPELAASFPLWLSYSVAVASVMFGGWSVLATSRIPEEDEELGWVESTAPAPTWESRSEVPDPPSWMRDL